MLINYLQYGILYQAYIIDKYMFLIAFKSLAINYKTQEISKSISHL